MQCCEVTQNNSDRKQWAGNTHMCVWDALRQAKRRLHSCKQAEHESNTINVKNVKNLIGIMKHYDGKLFDNKMLMDTIKEAAKNDENSLSTKNANVEWKISV